MMEGEASPRSRKRDHDSFEELADLEEPCSVPSDFDIMDMDSQPAKVVKGEMEVEVESSAAESLPTPPVSIGTKRDPSPARSSTGSLTDAGSVTPPRGQSPLINSPGSSTNLNLNLNMTDTYGECECECVCGVEW